MSQEAQGDERTRPIAAERGVTFPILVDRASLFGRLFGFGIVPTGLFFAADGTLRYRHQDDFDLADARVRMNLERFLGGEEPEPVDTNRRIHPAALDLFAQGVARFEADPGGATELWRAALRIDPDNFVIRSQIWATEHPEHFYPVVDRGWQEQQLLKEGYDKPLP